MNHKLRVLVRVDLDPGQVALEVTGCLTQSDFPALLHILRRAGSLGAGPDVRVDLHGASHLDPETLLQLRGIAEASAGPAGSGQSRVTLDEPAELPICLLHVGSDSKVLAGLEGEIAAFPPVEIERGDRPAGVAGGPLTSGIDDACIPLPAELPTINGLEVADYFEGTMDPAATVRALSDAALGQLADALYRHLDTSSPSFGAHTGYELAAEELQNRHQAVAAGPAEDELAAGPGVA